MQRTQRWRPDTCQCSVIEAFDDALPELPMTLAAYETKCAAHTGLKDDEAFAAITAENQAKNQAQNAAAKALGLTANDVDWAFDDKRGVVLTINPKPLPVEAQVEKLRTALQAIAAGQPLDPSALDVTPKVTAAQKAVLRTQFAGKAKVQ